MRSFGARCSWLFVPLACGGRQAAPTAAPPAISAPPVAVASAATEQNTTKLRAEPLDSPRSAASLSFVSPELGEQILLSDPRSYRVQLSRDVVDPAVAWVEVSLDAGRPRNLSPALSSVTLGELLSEDLELGPGSHWLFAAEVMASGLVPRSPAGGPRAAQGRRFFVGKTADEALRSTGAVWLRKPEGTYNGVKSSQSVTFDALAFSPLGAAIDAPCAVDLRSPEVSGRVLLGSPFALHDLPSGVYEVSASAAGAPASVTRFTVNRELGGGS